MSITRILWCAALAAGLHAASLTTVNWEHLPIVTGKTVSIAMPGGAVITGKATAVEADALVVDVKKTTDAQAWPKGPVRVPRSTLHRLEMQAKGKKFRVLCTVLGSAVGLTAGVAAALSIHGGILSNRNTGEATGALIGIWGGVTAAGYLAGNAADKRWTPVEVVD